MSFEMSGTGWGYWQRDQRPPLDIEIQVHWLTPYSSEHKRFFMFYEDRGAWEGWGTPYDAIVQQEGVEFSATLSFQITKWPYWCVAGFEHPGPNQMIRRYNAADTWDDSGRRLTLMKMGVRSTPADPNPLPLRAEVQIRTKRPEQSFIVPIYPSEDGSVHEGCFVPDNCILVFAQEKYGGLRELLVGPRNYPSLKAPPIILEQGKDRPTNINFDDAIQSLMVGNKVSVTLYEDKNFHGNSMEVPPGKCLADLGSMTKRAGSLKIASTESRDLLDLANIR